MVELIEDIYKSQNGDAWRLIRNGSSGALVVRHEANLSSGGHITEMDVDDFLSRGGAGPEYSALRALLQKQDELPAVPTKKKPAAAKSRRRS